MKTKKIVSDIIMNAIVWSISLVVLIPLVVILLNAFKSQAEANSMSFSLPKEWMFENFLVVVERGKLVASFLNSLLYAASSSVIIILIVAAAVFTLARNRSQFNRFIYYFLIAGISIPINHVALMEVMKLTFLMNTRIGIILIYTAMNIPLSIFLGYGFVNTIPKEIDEAAVIDGCTPIMLFGTVIIPLLKPILSTLFILNFMTVWNDFIMPLYFLNNSGQWPMTLAVYNFFGAFENSWNLVSANIVLTLLPVFIVFILGQKHIVGGISAGAVKG
ncbi:carbohydrate ABC transporter permease [Cellulosilyticum sp. I15G10I2]|uniref:carbohydrate ABC transporter permease n=1 Tax=Cellulosilyticum sp. I15G10I2 TaxID=1892843 RepID=UPI00085C716F|nr:carbohydrate ABC transporter permease [Cellulosilyticum sp. I15G10I2]